MAAHLSQSYLVAEALSATGLKNRAVLFAMDPYVKLTALPSKRSARCRKHAGGGRNPRWGGERGRLQLALAAADDRILVEVWNQNVMTPSDRVGRCELSVAAITADPQPFQLPLDTGGEVAIRARVADSAPAVPRSGGHTLGGGRPLGSGRPLFGRNALGVARGLERLVLEPLLLALELLCGPVLRAVEVLPRVARGHRRLPLREALLLRQTRQRVLP